MSALGLYVCGLIVNNPLQGGGKNFRLASLAICHPPDQNSETAPDISKLFLITSELYLDEFLLISEKIELLLKLKIAVIFYCGSISYL